MPRHKKPRTCRCPFNDREGMLYKPAGVPMTGLKQIALYPDELEALRLCDLEDLTQEEAGARMGVSRGTVQRLLASGRRKVVKAITERSALAFESEPAVHP